MAGRFRRKFPETDVGKKKILCVVGARPNFMKIAPIMAAMKGHPALQPILVHTGQHYDNAMNHQFFSDLGIPEPDVNLEVGSGTHAEQTADIMKRFEPVIDREHPDAVLVVGDVNSTIACALVASKKTVPVIHVEAGLRSFDRTMPEEINRILTDQISDLLFTTERPAGENLLREGIRGDRIHFVGNVMIDTLHRNLARAVPAKKIFEDAGAPERFLQGPYAALTLHRPSNVDHPDTLKSLLETIHLISKRIPVAFALHPRTRNRIESFGLSCLLENPNLLILPPLGYLQMLGLMKDAKLFLTDSGGVQEETTALGVPCITLRENTERTITVDAGSNTIVGTDRNKIIEAFEDILSSGGKAGKIPECWDGHASERIVDLMARWLQNGGGVA